MIDYFSLALAHALILLAFVRLLPRDSLDREDLLADDGNIVPEEVVDRKAQRRRRRERLRKETRDA